MKADAQLVETMRRAVTRLPEAERRRYLTAAQREVPGAGIAAEVVAREFGLSLPCGWTAADGSEE